MTRLAASLSTDPDRFPPPASAADVARALADWRADPARAAMADDRAAAKLLAAVFGNSPFLTHALLREPETALAILGQGPEPILEAALADFATPIPNTPDTMEVMRRMRRAKRQSALAIGIADIAGAWDGRRVTEALSAVADAALGRATAHLLDRLHARGDLVLPDPFAPERDSGVIVLGMGKLGARELNYSSDIDLIILYDHERIVYTGKDGLSTCMIRFARDLVRVVEARTADGYVFRTDLRLRPDPGSTPPAVSVIAAETYYESTGQNWERAAMIKARVVAGDRVAGQRFLDYLRPFVWRRSLDFAAIQDIHSIKRQINAHKGGAAIAIPGHNVKLGRGGIREIEFYAQTQQLIWGGRQPALRVADTCTALRRLAEAAHIGADAVVDLEGAYWYLRRLEHRLQMIDDRQTHSLPADADGIAAVAAFMGFADARSFVAATEAVLRRVEERYARLFEESPDLSGPGNLVFTGTEDDPDTMKTLGALGYGNPSMVAAAVRAWHHGRYRATRSTRAKEILTELMPTLLAALARTADPDEALRRFDAFLGGLPAGVQLFSLFQNNPGLLDLVAEVMGSTPRLADWLSWNPALLDGILTGAYLDPTAAPAALDAEIAAALEQARDHQDVLDVLRRWNNERMFRIGVRMIQGGIDPETAGAALSDTADAAMRAMLPAVERDFARLHGRVPGAAFAVVALGKLGGREMTAGSDLDLVFVYEADPAHETSDGARPLAALVYFTRLGQRLINAVTAPTGEGKLYEVDMRLRPSGNKGPIASALAAFVAYQTEAAWTWEHLALTRARVIAGPPEFAARIDAAIRAILIRRRDPAALAREVALMRERMAREHRAANIFDVKHLRGGLVDIEFIAQFLILRYAADHPGVRATNTTDALAGLAEAGLLDRARAEMLIGAMHLWRRVQGTLRLALAGDLDEAAAPEGLRRLLTRAAGAVDFEALRANVMATAARAHAAFVDIVEAASAPAGDKEGTR
ncbi:MAG: bifunctional [glutamine synthetase] adenylyltransferase/[glutamine synthetase]-adenylyl-L-tyrosine phosphorylase [Alphaproteobacteria bacterium]|nr:bifunctional [glutamine synthetase] adenylyltransferase/[glutamine synthetase]-adenylyl-L-tyrosine phosphorylase [Alphaproteobacteria bacterium]